MTTLLIFFCEINMISAESQRVGRDWRNRVFIVFFLVVFFDVVFVVIPNRDGPLSRAR